MSAVAELLHEGRSRRVYSAAAWSVGTTEGTLTAGELGTRRWDGPAVDGTELWDLASVTKPIVGLAVLALADRGALRLSDPVDRYLPQSRGGDKARITVRQLLAHTSGLPGGVPLFRSHPSRAELLEALYAVPLRGAPGSLVEYSSPGFILLGLLAEAATGRGLAELITELVCRPLGMHETAFLPGSSGARRAVSTEYCAWRGQLVTGQVHDENTVVLGGIAGHAGLFGTRADLDLLGRELLSGSPTLLRPETHATMISCQTEHLGLRRMLGWQGKDSVGCPVGDMVSDDSYGHTGFTGTSLWIDPAAGRYAVLLTNRVHPNRENPDIEWVRADFHRLALHGHGRN
ncbi:CubicO group peptidase (beta-lactamase class C family) [Tamaricihabitans halophyticus]|uniref:CubicO group peptidase (Beta-lactamase class C family) n=1 Tax=Tamaricihabitans halophyticus TaxID=1262583 RepID=A0A4R2QAZ2_9PSEU|nr:serine hydrolase domain-containing protein [Tamaricihabitans halophyticus]TCP45424.1 CubicO group peptidase (beta-lactamase class C family) [Tamaricihabitans halophyticus]